MLENVNLDDGKNPALSARDICVEPVCGCFKLDAAGMILYSRIESEKMFGTCSESFVGQNFFEKLTKFENAGELKSYFTNFTKSGEPTRKLVFDCRFENGASARTKILLTRVSEREFDGKRRIIIVDIRKICAGSLDGEIIKGS